MGGRILTLDFETKDPYIGLGLAGGWPYYLHHKEKSLFIPCGMAYRTHSGSQGYTSDWEFVRNLVDEHDILLAHNCQYDFGILLALGIPICNKLLLDTKILAFLYNNQLETHLGKLSEVYLKQEKTTDSLGKAVWENDLYPYTKKELTAKNKAEAKGLIYKRTDIPMAKLNKFAYENIPLLQEKHYDIVAKYAMQDVNLTWNLYEFFKSKGVDGAYYSDVIKLLINSRANGVRVDLEACRAAHQEFIPLIADALKDVYHHSGSLWGGFNVNSPKEVGDVLAFLGVKVSLTDSGNPSANDKVLLTIDQPIGRAIRKARKFIKLDRDFIQKMVDIQQYTLCKTPEEVDKEKYGVIFPHIQLFGTITGRFSSQGPNIQQIPAKEDKKEEHYAKLCRKIFIASSGRKWSNHDFSNQEGRLQVHVAKAFNCKGSQEIVDLFIKDPDMDLHQVVADIAKINRDQAKAVNFAISYGRGQAALAESLTIDIPKTKVILRKYHSAIPYLKDASDIAKKRWIERQWLKTIKGRIIRRDMQFEYRAFNYLIQGSAGDQIIEALKQCYNKGIRVLFSVHDEINAEITKEEEANEIDSIMINAIPLCIPVTVKHGIGNNWAEAGH